MTKVILRAGAVVVCLLPVWLAAQGQGQGQPQGQAQGQGRGGGGRISMPQQEEIGPAPALRNLFTQEAYTEYQILEPGSESFRIKYLPEVNRAGATELLNATRGGSEGSGVEVYDPRTGKPLKFVYEPSPSNPADHQIRATLPMPVPEGGIGRVLIYKTYKDERTYRMDGQDIAWVRSLSGYRLGVVLPKGFAFISSNVAAQLSTTADGRLKLAFANPSGQSNPVTVRARKTTAVFTPSKFDDMFFDDIKTLYDLDANGAVKVEQTYSDYRKGDSATLDSLAYLPLDDLKVIDLDTAKPFTPAKTAKGTTVKLEVPITDDKQSAHLRITGTIKNGYKIENDELVFERTLHGLRNTVLLPAGWEVSAVSQSGTIGMSQSRAFVALINLNSENQYKVIIRAHKGTGQ